MFACVVGICSLSDKRSFGLLPKFEEVPAENPRFKETKKLNGAFRYAHVVVLKTAGIPQELVPYGISVPLLLLRVCEKLRISDVF